MIMRLKHAPHKEKMGLFNLEKSQGDLTSVDNYLIGEGKIMEPDSPWWCLGTGQEAMGTN